jgi:hypothetical protein
MQVSKEPIICLFLKNLVSSTLSGCVLEAAVTELWIITYQSERDMCFSVSMTLVLESPAMDQ